MDNGLLAAGFALQVLVTFGGMAWSAGKLNAAIGGLKESIQALTSALDHLDEKHDQHSDRLARIETQVGVRSWPRNEWDRRYGRHED